MRELIQKFDANIQYQESDLVDYETDLAHLYQPFKGLLNIYKSNLNKSIKENKLLPFEPLNSKIMSPNDVDSKNKVIKSKFIFLFLIFKKIRFF